MKAMLVILVLLILGVVAHATGTDPIVKDTTIKAQTYHIYQGSKGGRYIMKTSQKTKKEYKAYLKK